MDYSTAVVKIEGGMVSEFVEGGKMENPYNIEKEKLEWLESVGAMFYERPMICHVEKNGDPYFMYYSKEYIDGTPLEEIKRGLDRFFNE